MAGGQQIDSSQGTLVAVGGDNNQAMTGSASTSAAGTAASAVLVRLKSLKVGGGTASQALTGAASTGALGTVGFGKGKTLTGSAITGQQGAVTYGGRATISWNANTESDLAGYRVWHGTTPGNTTTDFVTLGLVTTYQWSGLAGGQTHYFTVTAFDTSNNESAKSAEVSKAY